MKKSEALQKLTLFTLSLDEQLSESEKLDKIINFLEQEKIMLPAPQYQSKEGVAYYCEWEDEIQESE